MEQRAGRSLRQGNRNPVVKMFKYVTKGTFDAYNWSLVENKQKFIGQIMTGKSPARSAEDVDATALSYAEVKALATGDDRIRQKMELDVEVAKLKVLKASHTNQVYLMQDKVIQYYPRKIASEQLFIEAMRADLPIVQQHPVKDDAFSMTIQGKVYTERKAAGEAIIKICSEITDPDAVVDLGEYRGFPMQVSLHGEKFAVSMKQNLTYSADLSSEPVGNIQRINNALERIKDDLEAHISLHDRLESDMAATKAEAEKPFPKEAELQAKLERLNELNHELENDPHPEERDDDEEELDEEELDADELDDGADELDREDAEEAEYPEDQGEPDEPEERDEAGEPDKPESREPVEECPKAEPTVKPETRGGSRQESAPGNSFHRDNPSRHEGGKPSIRDQLHGYTPPPARVAAPPDRKRPGVML